MNIAGMILGILGGLAGIGGATFALFVGGVGAAFDPEGGRTVMGLGLSAYLFAILALIGGAAAMWKPRMAGWFQIIAAVGGLISVSLGWIGAFPLLLVGGIISIVSARKPEGQSRPA